MQKYENSPETLITIIQRWAVWYRLRRAFYWSIYGLLLGLALMIGFSVTFLGQAIIVFSEYVFITIALSVIATSIAAILGYSWNLSKQTITRFFDKYFSLLDRASTAWELYETENHYPGSNSLVLKQREDTIIVARVVEPELKFFVTGSRFQTALILSMIGILVIVGLISEPVFRLAQERQGIHQIILQENQSLEALKIQIEQNELLTAQQRFELTRELDQTIRKLGEAKSLEQAVAALEDGELAVQRIDRAILQQQATDLRQAGQQILNRAEGNSALPLNKFAEESANDKPIQAAQELINMNIQNMSLEERDNLVDQLEQLAQNIGSSNPEMAEQLLDAAQALRQGDLSATQRALEQAAQKLTETARELAQAQSAQLIAGQLNQSRSRLIQAGQNLAHESRSGNDTSQGVDQNSPQGNNDSNSASQNLSTGAGAGRGTNNASEQQGNEVDNSPINQNNSPGDGGERQFEEVHSPTRIGGVAGTDVTLPPSNTMDEAVKLSGTSPGIAGPSKVPIGEISPTLVDAYRNYYNREDIPPSLRQLIKNYYYNITQP